MEEKRDRWIAVGLAHQFRPGASNPAMVDGHPIAIWRGENGPPNVWEDRCPHRGMRLSFGFVRDNTLRCIYHGWGYGNGGQCTSIPAHPELKPPKTICAKVYAAETRYGLLWTNLAEAPVSPMPNFGSEEGWHPVRSLIVNRPPEDSMKLLETADHGISDAVVRSSGDGTATIDAGAHLTLLVAVQPVDPAKTALHFVARGEAASDAQRRLNVARKLERLRSALEAQ